jgi:phage shock protein PspC (stress-responsive transcriptional regulator)
MMLEILFIFFILSGVFAWGVIAYVVINLLWESK